MAEEAELVAIWKPQPGPQTALLSCPVFEVFYGGARGGGKTDGMLGEWAQHAQTYGVEAVGVFFRRELTQLDEAIERSKQLYGRLGASWSEQKKQWVFPNGARLKFRYLENDSDAEAYQGHSYTRLYFEELTNFPNAGPVMKLKATLRSSAGVPCRFRGTGNPGGPGHQWVKARYIDPAPGGYQPLDDGDGLARVFIPARISDNAALAVNDPLYVARLRQSGSEAVVRAWLDGDWSVIEGAYFDCWSTRMVLRPCELPSDWQRFRSFDWGSAKPFSVGWWAIATDDWTHPDGAKVSRGSMVRYREWYGASGPNTGLKLTAEEVARGIKEREAESIVYGVADPAIFSEDGGPSIAERMGQITTHDGRPAKGLVWVRADNKRVSQKGALGGWDQLRERMKAGTIFCFSTCKDSIRTIPSLQHDSLRPEDLDTAGEDHAADEWRYAVMSRVRGHQPTDTSISRPDGWDAAFDTDEGESWRVQ